ncbi:hypothetical protein T492DRAFT_109309 [Pavlovales sp. CCMP2436]|nr:hypothetical protein T492DRAFT_109309 [Pavlovales sp. CCMP2436]
MLYREGKGVPENHSMAARYFLIATDHGDSGPLCQDYGECVRYHRLATDQGFPQSMLALSAMLIDDEHVSADVRAREPADPRAGAKLIARAAQSMVGSYHAPEHRQTLELLRSHADLREVVSVCCIGCGKTKGLEQCTRCHVAGFCGSACMRQAWPIHKQCCKEWAESRATTSRSSDDAEARGSRGLRGRELRLAGWGACVRRPAGCARAGAQRDQLCSGACVNI